MPSYVVLAQFTDQGLREVGTFVRRARENVKRAEEAGLKVTPYVTMGEYDQVLVVEAPDDQTALTAVMALAGQGNVRTRTLRAFTLDEVEQAMAAAPPGSA